MNYDGGGKEDGKERIVGGATKAGTRVVPSSAEGEYILIPSASTDQQNPEQVLARAYLYRRRYIRPRRTTVLIQIVFAPFVPWETSANRAGNRLDRKKKGGIFLRFLRVILGLK